MERGFILRSYFVGGNMTDKRKIEILERLVSNQQQEINELRQKKAELQAKIYEYSALDDDVQELRNLIKEAKHLNSELNVSKNKHIKSQKEYEREMKLFFLKQKRNKF